MKFVSIIGIAILSYCCLNLASAEGTSRNRRGLDDLVKETGNAIGGVVLPECGAFDDCYGKCTYYTFCAIFDSKCKLDCALKCACHHSAANTHVASRGVTFLYVIASIAIATFYF